MNVAPTLSTAATAPAAAPGRRVTDAPTRMFHWLFALSFVGAYLTADGERWRMLHVTLGYTMAGLLVFRVLYGLFGPRQAGLGLLWRKLGSAPAWLRSLRTAPSLAAIHWRQGQNLLMALAVVALLVLVLPLTLSGYATFNEWGVFPGDDTLGELHEFFGEAMLFVVLAHLALILALSVLRRKNQAAPMLTGRVDGPGPNLVPHNRGWLAALLLMAVLAYGAWEWQQSPRGLVPTSAWSQVSSGDGDDD
ncbi:cytochrome b/b6 domain-containing protein [Hydrogenophaga sp. SL48]|uniref:cytochrome b/b6 domain-containing protein n=1 Tax=Hydrogenophaga sp. SL48 TaxID=2806347 RepID=UPI001F028AB8|nr:cytochrome b/b6 domain-containing protein [Hydrogenophaga sp. SL48]UJW80072.1 cytochrome b/b6 domain-containing protein [Hydrogenophaga sp. SL48]